MTYSSTLAMNRSRFAGNNQIANQFKVQNRLFGQISNSVLIIVLACVLGLLYLTQVTQTNNYGYQINALQQQQTALKAQENNLLVASAQLQSVQSVQNSAVAKTMVPVSPSGIVR